MTSSRPSHDKRRTDPLPTGPVFLETKLHPPATDARLVDRSRLFELLDAGAGRRLTLVTAPTGFGKTTVLAAWCAAQRDRRAAAWVSLDAGDNDPLRLWTYVAEALSRIHPTVGRQSLAALRAPRPGRGGLAAAAERAGHPAAPGDPGAG
jgi:LuxR family maltose regulon positive regulatory protein